jgi:hypothetical protein
VSGAASERKSDGSSVASVLLHGAPLGSQLSRHKQVCSDRFVQRNHINL